jgi:hypothetical protein
VRALLVALVLAVVLAASALNLALGATWVVALVAIAGVRRRMRYAAWLVLLLALAGGGAAAQRGWLAPPHAASYATDEVGWLGERIRALAARAGRARTPHGAPVADGAAAVRQRLAARRQEELGGPSARQLEQRAVAAIAVSRDVARLRQRAPAEVAALEEAVRQLALTLTAPEFRDLDGREAHLSEWLTDLGARLAVARDQADLDVVMRGLEPAAMATVSLRPLREDLARVAAGSAALVRALSAGGGVTVSATAQLAYDESRAVLVDERRVRFVASPSLRLTRLDAAAVREPPGPALAAQTVSYAVDGSEARPLAPGVEVVPGGEGSSQLLLLDRRERPLPAMPIVTPLRRLRFVRLRIPLPAVPPPDFPARVRVDGAPGAEPLLVLAATVARLESLRVPRHAFHHADAAGVVESGPDGDVWRPAAGDGADLVVELVPDRPLLRTAAFARLRPFLYTPSVAGGLAVVGLAALAVTLAGRPRRPPPPPTVPGEGGAARP